MRLINVNTLSLTFFDENSTPAYIILSHSWGADEVTFQELSVITRLRELSSTVDSQATQPTQHATNDQSGADPALVLAAVELLVRGSWSPGSTIPDISEEALMKRQGYAKIAHSARIARELGYEWVWIDTCAIDKTSSAELQESINSMYKWYKDAALCIVYLNDIPPPMDGDNFVDTQATLKPADNPFARCRWATRGWTLQELVAPASVRFYYDDWSLMGDKREFIEELSDATGIPIFVLENGDISEVSIAERMSWASNRNTTRIEDIAYCLLGIFDIQMPLLYGEGEKAFIRLQEEILKSTDDYSIFAWRARSASHTLSGSIYRGLLARHPREFHGCGPVEREHVYSNSPINSTSLGIRIQLEFLADPDANSKDKSRFLAMIHCTNNMNQRFGIYLRSLDSANQYARVDADKLVPIDDWPTGQPRTIYVRQKLVISPNFYTPEIQCFRAQRRTSNHSIPPVRITHAYPPEYWSQENLELRIPESSKTFLGVLFVRAHSSSYGASTLFQIIVGLDRSKKHYWCKAVDNTPALTTSRSRWQAKAWRLLPQRVLDPLMAEDVRHDLYVVGESDIGIMVNVRAGFWADTVVLQVLVDGLVKEN